MLCNSSTPFSELGGDVSALYYASIYDLVQAYIKTYL